MNNPKKTDILAINPGSTSTKLGVFRNMEVLFVETINHNPNHLLAYETLEDQLAYRNEVIASVLDDKGYDKRRLKATVGRGGMLRGLKAVSYTHLSILWPILSFASIQASSLKNAGKPVPVCTNATASSHSALDMDL